MMEFFGFLLACVWGIVKVLVGVVVGMLLGYTITVIIKSMRRDR